MKNNLMLILVLLTFMEVKAQFIKEKSIDVSIGIGLSTPYAEQADVTGSGFYVQGEYVLAISSWFDIRPYAGLILTKTDDNDNNPKEFESTTNAALVGGKARIKMPIPWVSPYVEIGIGASIGSFETVNPIDNIKKSGLISHIPFSIGLELGKKHNFDFALTYYYQNSVQQFTGAIAFGFKIPLTK